MWRCLHQLLKSSSSQEIMSGRCWSMTLTDLRPTSGCDEIGSSKYLYTVSQETSSALLVSETLCPLIRICLIECTLGMPIICPTSLSCRYQSKTRITIGYSRHVRERRQFSQGRRAQPRMQLQSNPERVLGPLRQPAELKQNLDHLVLALSTRQESAASSASNSPTLIS